MHPNCDFGSCLPPLDRAVTRERFGLCSRGLASHLRLLVRKELRKAAAGCLKEYQLATSFVWRPDFSGLLYKRHYAMAYKHTSNRLCKAVTEVVATPMLMPSYVLYMRPAHPNFLA